MSEAFDPAGDAPPFEAARQPLALTNVSHASPFMTCMHSPRESIPSCERLVRRLGV